ncbi:RING/U-box superfamily protein, putative isoform 2 [Hibiscus syriacus]|uniref:RING/U-box superfamily protein, putative isoform 2 n=1 Tax=Hibiscus syriacus TaxID=106335 RepID=A0A6A3C3T8_HIBSY|nr:RING/U-box superfamily protein, putative isoform 2 [Hibiscus syriacus]
MEDMDIDSVVDIPDTPDRPSLKQVKGGNFVDKVGGSNTTGEGSLDRLRGRGRLLSANGFNRKHYMHPQKLSDSTCDIERLKNTIVLSPEENARERAPLFRKTRTERSRNSLGEQNKDKGKAPCSKLPSKSSGFPEDHAILDLTEQKTHKHISEMESLQSGSENCIAEGRKGQAPRNGGFHAFNSSRFSETSRNSCKGKEKVDDIGLKSIGSVTSNGKGVSLSNGSPLRMEKQLPASHQSIASPRAVEKRRLVRNGCISPHNIAIRAKQNEKSQNNFTPEQNFVNVGSSSPCLISEIVAEDNDNDGKGKRVAHAHASTGHDINFISLSGSPMSNNGEAGGIGDANRDACFEEKGGWRSTRNRSKNVDQASKHHLSGFNNVGCQVSQRNENGFVKRNHASGGKIRILCDSPETHATETAPVISKINQPSEPSHANMLPERQMKHILSSRNNGESSRVTPNDPDIVFLGSTLESSQSRSSRIHIAEHLNVMDLDNSSQMRGIHANHIDSMNDEDTS